MAKVKPYIITVKYVSFYEDPRPTVEQIANELNMDAIEITIEDAVVTPKPKAAPPAPSVEYDVENRTITFHDVPAQEPAAPVSSMFKKDEAPFDTYDLDRNGPSMKILSTLYREGKKGRTAKSIREATGLSSSTTLTTINRLKKRGRVKQIGVDGTHALYVFVK